MFNEYDPRVYIPDITKEYKKVSTDIKKKHQDISNQIESSLTSLHKLQSTSSLSEYNSLVVSLSPNIIMPLKQIAQSKLTKLYIQTLSLLKKLILYSHIAKVSSPDITFISKVIFDTSNEDLQLKVLELLSSLINATSTIFDINDHSSIANSLIINLKAFSSNKGDTAKLFKIPAKLALKQLIELVFNKSNNFNVQLYLIQVLIELTEGKKKEYVNQYSIYIKCLALELLSLSLNEINITHTYDKCGEIKTIINDSLIKTIHRLFVLTSTNECIVGIKLCKITIILLTKYAIAYELIDCIVKYAQSGNNSSFTWQRHIGIETCVVLIRNAEFMKRLFVLHKERYAKLIDTVCKLTNESVGYINMNSKDNETYNNAVGSKVVLKNEIFTDGDECAVVSCVGNNNAKVFEKLIYECFDGVKQMYMTVLNEGGIKFNYLNKELNEDQVGRREMIGYKSDVIKYTLINVIHNVDCGDEVIQNYLSVYQSLTTIYGSVALTALRDEFISGLCELIKQLMVNKGGDNSGSAKESSNTSNNNNSNQLESAFNIRKVLITQTLLNLSHCIDLLDINSWCVLIQTLQQVKEHLELLHIINPNISDIYDVDVIENETLNYNSKKKHINNNNAKHISTNNNNNNSEYHFTLTLLLSSIDILFIDSQIFLNNTLTNITTALYQILQTYLESTSPSPPTYIIFTLTKLYQLSLQNIPRIELIYPIITNAFDLLFQKQIPDKTTFFTIDIICSLSSQILSKYTAKAETDPLYKAEWSKDVWQRTVYTPIMQIATQLNPSKDVINRLLSNIIKAIHSSCKHFDTFGWSSLIESSSILFNNNAEGTFCLLKVIINEYGSYLSPFNITPLLSLLSSFAINNSKECNCNEICYNAVELFNVCADITEKFQQERIEFTKYQKEAIQELEMQSKDMFYNEIWKNIFYKLKGINNDNRSEIQTKGINVFSEIYVNKINNISEDNREYIIKDVFMKMMLVNISKFNESKRQKQLEDIVNISINAVRSVVRSYINNTKSYKNEIYVEFVSEITKVISLHKTTPNVVINVLKCVNQLTLTSNDVHYNKLLMDNFNEYWNVMMAIETYIKSDAYRNKYSSSSTTLSSSQANKLPFTIIESLILNISNESNYKYNGNLFSPEQIRKYTSLLSIMLNQFTINDIFTFIDKCTSIQTTHINLEHFYIYCNDLLIYDYTKKITEQLSKRIIQSIILIYKNEHFDYSKHINDLLSKLKKFILYRGQNEYIEMMCKTISLRKDEKVFFFYTAHSLMELLTVLIPKIHDETIWLNIINLFTSVFKQSEVGFKGINRVYQETVIRSSMEMEIEIINFIVDVLFPHSLFLSQQIQMKLLTLLDMGCNVDYSSYNYNTSLNVNSSTISQICILNLFELCSYKSNEDILKENQTQIANFNEEKQIEFINMKIKIAKICTPILIKRCRDMLKKFLEDEIKSGAMPLLRSRFEEVKFVFDKIKALEVYPNFLCLDSGSNNSNNGKVSIDDLCVMDVISKSRKAHLFYLHPILAEFITTKENEVKIIIRDIFKMISEQMGIKEISSFTLP